MYMKTLFGVSKHKHFEKMNKLDINICVGHVSNLQLTCLKIRKACICGLFSLLGNMCSGCFFKPVFWGWYPSWNTTTSPPPHPEDNNAESFLGRRVYIVLSIIETVSQCSTQIFGSAIIAYCQLHKACTTWTSYPLALWKVHLCRTWQISLLVMGLKFDFL